MGIRISRLKKLSLQWSDEGWVDKKRIMRVTTQKKLNYSVPMIEKNGEIFLKKIEQGYSLEISEGVLDKEAGFLLWKQINLYDPQGNLWLRLYNKDFMPVYE